MTNFPKPHDRVDHQFPRVTVTHARGSLVEAYRREKNKEVEGRILAVHYVRGRDIAPELVVDLVFASPHRFTAGSLGTRGARPGLSGTCPGPGARGWRDAASWGEGIIDRVCRSHARLAAVRGRICKRTGGAVPPLHRAAAHARARPPAQGGTPRASQQGERPGGAQVAAGRGGEDLRAEAQEARAGGARRGVRLERGTRWAGAVARAWRARARPERRSPQEACHVRGDCRRREAPLSGAMKLGATAFVACLRKLRKRFGKVTAVPGRAPQYGAVATKEDLRGGGRPGWRASRWGRQSRTLWRGCGTSCGGS